MKASMPAVAFVVPGSIDAVSGGSIYNRRISAGLRQIGWTVDVLELDDRFPYPTPDVLANARQTLAAVPDAATVVIDGLALGAMPDAAAAESSRLQIVALVHLPLAAAVGISAAAAAGFRTTERRALAAARLVIVTGVATVDLLEGYGVPPGRICVVEPGTDPAALAHGSGGAVLRLLTVATLNPGKGYEVLLRALARLRDLDWELTCVGSTTRDSPTADRVRALARDLGLAGRVTFVGEADREALADHYARSDVFVLATRRETYGMAIAEALARGLPVVSTTTGAIPELVGESAGLLVPPEDVAALTGALERVISDAGLRRRLAAGARLARRRLPTWEQAARQMHDALGRVNRVALCPVHG
jgi:glycosyltransferase involved in cell wall biosynthesis